MAVSEILPEPFAQLQETFENSSTETLLDVPLENQYENDPLENGCEVTALSMLLQYYGYDTNKNQLADLLNYVPVYVTDQLHGNPHDGFVGDITGGFNAMGVDVEPIAAVAEQIVQEEYQVIASDDTPFAQIEDIVKQGSPVWTIVTIDFQVPEDESFFLFETANGLIEFNPLCHAAVITGIVGDVVYVNDPEGYKDRPVPKQDLQLIYEKMGRQSLYLRH